MRCQVTGVGCQVPYQVPSAWCYCQLPETQHLAQHPAPSTQHGTRHQAPSTRHSYGSSLR